jgi:hypothetical protein
VIRFSSGIEATSRSYDSTHIGVMQTMGQMKKKIMKHKTLIRNENDRYFATTNRGEDNSLWYF